MRFEFGAVVLVQFPFTNQIERSSIRRRGRLSRLNYVFESLIGVTAESDNISLGPIQCRDSSMLEQQHRMLQTEVQFLHSAPIPPAYGTP